MGDNIHESVAFSGGGHSGGPTGIARNTSSQDQVTYTCGGSRKGTASLVRIGVDGGKRPPLERLVRLCVMFGGVV